MNITTSIPIFFAANVGYYQHLCVLIVSILENNKDSEFSFYVLTDQEEFVESGKIIRLKDTYKNFDICFKQIDNSILASFPLPPHIGYISVQMYYRYLIPELFQKLDKAIYLDCDTVCEGNLSELWKTNIDGYYIAGAECQYIVDINFKPTIGFTNDDLYINSGVLLMNLKKMRDDHICKILFENTKRLKAIIRYPDQDVINFTFKGKIKVLDARFNWAKANSAKIRQISALHPSVVISHFTGQAKPWTTNANCVHESAQRYFYYLNKTPYRNFIYRYRLLHFFQYVVPSLPKRILKGLLPKVIVDFLRHIQAKISLLFSHKHRN